MSNHRLVPYTNAHRYRQVPTPARMAAMSAARAALGSASPTPQGIAAFGSDNNNLPVGSTGSNDAMNALMSMAGLGGSNILQRLGGGIKNDKPYSNFFNPAMGTEFGAHLQETGMGRAVAQMIGAQHSLDFGRTWSSMTGVGGPFYGRGVGKQLVSGGKHGEHGWTLVGDISSLVTKSLKALEKFPYDLPWFLHAGPKSQWLLEHPGMDPKYYGKLHSYPVGPGGPVSPSPNMGYYPAGGAVSSGGPAMISNVMMAAIAEAIKRMGQQAHEPAWSSPGGGGTSMAPESVVLRGMKHPYDWVAMRGVG